MTSNSVTNRPRCVNLLALRDKSFGEKMREFILWLLKRRDKQMSEGLKTLQFV